MKKATKNKPKNEINATEYVKNKIYTYKANGYNHTGKYTGDWKNGKPEGKGMMTYNNGDVYNGEWKNGQREGNGELECKNRMTYNGQYKNDRASGKGIMKYKNGDVYDGEWMDNKPCGACKVNYSNGSKYEGNWYDTGKKGEGKFQDRDGNIYQGIWTTGGALKEGTISFKNGITAKIKDYTCIKINREKLDTNQPMKHTDTYAISLKTEGKLQVLSKIGKYGEYKDILCPRTEKDIIDNDVINQISKVCNDIEQKISNKQMDKITVFLNAHGCVFLNAHGSKQRNILIYKEYILKLFNKLSEILKKHQDVKIYIENIACYAAINFPEVGSSMEDKSGEINDLEKAIEKYFGEYQKRVFYTKSAVEDKTVLSDPVVVAHTADDCNRTKFDYYYIDDKFKLVKYKGKHEDAKKKKNKDLNSTTQDINKKVDTSLTEKDKNCMIF